ncbi:MAG: hypothetical protein EOP48_25025 [Sphingobacteriales bacterium]|nr:MAG: hypothetical protein EOP48_25025 [Sphingobacteriales bacterium]
MNKNVITIATGKQLYIDMAVNLARSFLLWNNPDEISFYIVTDHPQYVPDDIKQRIKIYQISPGELGEGFSSKLHLDRLAPEGQTLFIDSDCLVFGNIDSIFTRFKGHSVSVVGKYINDTEWFGNIKEICAKFGIPHLVKFNGGIYYLEKGDAANAVYSTARKLEREYDEIGFIRLRNKPNDEVIMALSMQLHNQPPVEEDGTIMGEFVNFQSGFKGDIFAGKAALYNTPGHEKYQKDWPLKLGTPLIVHFLGDHTNIYPYITFKKQLELISKGQSAGMAKAISFVSVSLPWLSKFYLKEILRPVYRKVAGVRNIKKSERIID